MLLQGYPWFPKNQAIRSSRLVFTLAGMLGVGRSKIQFRILKNKLSNFENNKI